MTYYSKCLEILDYFKKGYFTLNPDSTAVYLQNSIQANIINTLLPIYNTYINLNIYYNIILANMER